MNKTVVGSFDDFDQAHRVVEELERQGVSTSDISLVAGDRDERHAARLRASPRRFEATPADDASGADDTGTITGVSAGSVNPEFGQDAASTHDSRARTADSGDVAASAGTGAVTGGVLGGAVGLVAGLAGLAIPGVGPLVAAGPILAALTGAGVGAVAGGLIGGLRAVGVPHEEAEYYAESVRRGAALVTVRTDDAGAAHVADVLRRCGAVDIKGRVAKWKESGWKGYDAEAHAQAAPATALRTATAPATTASGLSTAAPVPTTPSRIGTGSGANLTATMSAGTASTMGETGGNTSMEAGMGATDPTTTGESSAPLGTRSRPGVGATPPPGTGSQVGSTASSMGALAGTGNPASPSGVNRASMGGTDALYGTTAPPDATRSDLPESGVASGYSGSGQQGATATLSGSASAGMSEPGSSVSHAGTHAPGSTGGMAQSSAGMQSADSVAPDAVNRPGVSDDLQRGADAARRGAQRAGDAIERALPGDADRDGK